MNPFQSPTEYALRAIKNAAPRGTPLLIAASGLGGCATALFIVAAIGWHRGLCLYMLLAVATLFVAVMAIHALVRRKQR